MAIYTYTTNTDEDLALAAVMAPINQQRVAQGLPPYDGQTFWTVTVAAAFQKQVNITLKATADAIAQKFLLTTPAGRITMQTILNTVPDKQG